eukprot:1161009-Pelagomonas_calceolata.AAC.8
MVRGIRGLEKEIIWKDIKKIGSALSTSKPKRPWRDLSALVSCDNLGATLDLTLLSHFASSGNAFLMEVSP